MRTDVAGRIRMRLTYSDVDMVQFFFGNYYHWMDRALAELFEVCGYARSRGLAEGVGFPVVESGCKYLKRAVVDQILTVEARFSAMSERSFRVAYVFTHEDGSVAAEGFTQHVCVNIHEMKARAVPVEFSGSSLQENSR
jgi:acyl-CoA thioester hydrolase